MDWFKYTLLWRRPLLCFTGLVCFKNSGVPISAVPTFKPITMQSTTLAALLQYKNENVISRFTDLYDVPEHEAEDIFTETKKFLYISRQPGVFIPDELLIVDEMWHNFILFTSTYHEFCAHYFGGFLHHLPASKAEKIQLQLQLAADTVTARNAFKEKLTTFMSITYDQLGRETVMKWFQEYPQRYSKQAIKNLRKH
jgi:hypothetical protein